MGEVGFACFGLSPQKVEIGSGFRLLGALVGTHVPGRVVRQHQLR